MIINRIILFVIVFSTVMVIGCGTTGDATLYTEFSIPSKEVEIRTVAIMPNRLPVNLQDDEKWRSYNWEVLQEKFQSNGYRVIDYITSVDQFQKSGLPMEDTKSSRDKYADLAEKLNADLLIFPYYGISYQRSGVIEINSYIAIGTLQIFSRKHNDFLARIDFNGEDWYANFGTLSSIATIAASLVADANSVGTISMVGGLMSLTGILANFESADSRWQAAFTEGISAGTDAFFAKYAPTKSSSSRSYEYNKPVAPKNIQYGKYESYTVDQLQKMKKDAVDKKDFKTAGEINQELLKRK